MAACKIVQIVNLQRGHIPPITTTESNPFPYDLKIKMGGGNSGGGGGGGGSGGGGGGGGGDQEGWGGKMGIFLNN